MKRLVVVARILLGLPFLVFGLNGLLQFLQPAGELPEGAAAFLEALEDSGYMLPLLAGVQTVCGALLIVNRFVPLALTLLAPVLVNIVGFHVAFQAPGTTIGVVLLVLELLLAWAYRESFRGVLAARAEPVTGR